MKVGDRVKFRDDATSEGKPIGELFMRLEWTVESLEGDDVKLVGKYLQSELTMYTLAHKLRVVLPS